MRIAILASNSIRIPPEPADIPKGFSGAPESITSVITESLVARGHEVTLFASGDSRTSAHLSSVTPQSVYSLLAGDMHHAVDYEYALISHCYRQANEGRFDVIHSMLDIRSLTFAPMVSTPTVVTLHSPITGIQKDLLMKNPRGQWYVPISSSQKRNCPDLAYTETVYHGISPNEYPIGDGKGEYLMFVGRMLEEKGPDDAVAAAKNTQSALHLFGESRENDVFWNDKILPFVNTQSIIHQGFLPRNAITDQYQHAKALLFPIKWEEPFGLVMIEAMACGTPVIAYNRGSVPEIVKDGVTGFIVDPDPSASSGQVRPGKGNWSIKKQGIAGLVEAIGRIGEIDRQACRKHVEEHFTVGAMVSGYETVYAKILASKGDAF